MTVTRFLVLAIVLGAASARYVAIPLIQNYRFVQLEDGPPRFVRQLPYDEIALPSQKIIQSVPVPEQKVTLESLEAVESQRFERQAGGDGHDHVDYGAHTGHHGAFGWYADFPVHSQ